MSTITPVRGTGGATERGHVSLSVPRFGRLLPFFDSTSLQDKLRVFLAQKKNKYWVKCLDLLLGEKVSPAGLDSSVDPALSGCLSDQESPHPSAECVGLGRHFPNPPPPPPKPCGWDIRTGRCSFWTLCQPAAQYPACGPFVSASGDSEVLRALPPWGTDRLCLM